MFHLLQIRTSIDIFKNKKCKITFGLEESSAVYLMHLLVFRVQAIFKVNDFRYRGVNFVMQRRFYFNVMQIENFL